MPSLFALTLCLAAALLFSVQPMVAKGFLPLLGGSPAVWTTCMLFFQAMLLAGYVYAHVLSTRLAIRGQVIVHAVALAVPLVFAPVALAQASTVAASGSVSPTAWLLGALLVSAGAPCFVVATTAPLVQRWFVETGHRTAGDPYFLYGASNIGSLLALAAYPFVVEPNLPLAAQARVWTAGFALLAGLVAACGALAAMSPRCPAAVAVPRGRVQAGRWWWWVFLAFVPSSLMLAVTAYLSADIAPVPLIWAVPLALYLLSFILVFARRPPLRHSAMVRVMPLGVMALTVVLGFGLVQPWWIILHLATFFAAAMVCHGELAHDRPEAEQITSFYLALALGGALGGVFNALVAPVVFHRLAEYPLGLVMACLILPGQVRRGDTAIPTAVLVLSSAAVWLDLRGTGSAAALAGFSAAAAAGLLALVCWTHRSRPARFALGIGAVLVASGFSSGVNGRDLFVTRNFFGVIEVTENASSRTRRLFHGRTLHGEQSLDPKRRLEPSGYYDRSGPIGQIFAVHRGNPTSPNVGVAGLGTGALACYAERGEHWTFYEIDPAVIRVARDPYLFTFLRDSRAASLEVSLGDARIQLARARDGAFGLIVMDAFLADAIPVHLLTREAMQLYRRKLAPGGLIAVHISNRYLDLDPVVGALAADAGLVCRVRYDLAVAVRSSRPTRQPTICAVLAACEADLGPLAVDPRWQPPRHRPGSLWRDDFSNIVGSLRFRSLRQ